MNDPDLKHRVRIVSVPCSMPYTQEEREQEIAALLDQGYVIEGMSSAAEFDGDTSDSVVTVLLVKAPPF